MRRSIMHLPTKRWLVLWSAGCLAGEVLFAQATPAERPSLVGRWQLNHSQSDDAAAKLREVLRRSETTESDEAGTPPGGGGRGGRRGGGGASRSPGASAMGSGEEALTLSEFVTVPERLEISAAAGGISLLGPTATAAWLDPNGKWIRGQDGRQVRAEWKDDGLVTEVRCSSGPKTKTTYRLLPGRRQLEVLSRLELALGGSVMVRRVYDSMAGVQPPL